MNSSLEIRKKCGYLPGNFAAYAHLTGKEFLQFCAKMRDKSTGNIHELLKKFKFDMVSLKSNFLSQKFIEKCHVNKIMALSWDFLSYKNPINKINYLRQEKMTLLGLD